MSLARLRLMVGPLHPLREGATRFGGGLVGAKGLVSRGLFGKATGTSGKSQSKVLSSAEDGITQLEGEVGMAQLERERWEGGN